MNYSQLQNSPGYFFEPTIFIDVHEDMRVAREEILGPIVSLISAENLDEAIIGAEIHLPFGGTKASGNGAREAGTKAIDEFTNLKTVYFDYSGRLQKAQIDLE